MVSDSRVLYARVIVEALLGIELGKTDQRLERRGVQLRQLLVHGNGFHHKAIGGVGVPHFSEVIHRLVTAPEPGIQVADCIQNGEVFRILLENLFIFGNGVLQLALLHEFLSHAEKFFPVKTETERHV